MTLKNKKQVKFSMKTTKKEMDLVLKFNFGEIDSSFKLNLGPLGSYMFDEISDMRRDISLSGFQKQMGEFFQGASDELSKKRK